MTRRNDNEEIIGVANSDAWLRKSLLNVSGTPVLSSFQQLWENGMDAEADKFTIDVDKASDQIIAYDNGTGFSKPNAKAFVSICQSNKVDNNTVGQHGSGHLQVFSFAEEIVVYTRSIDYRTLHAFSVSIEEVMMLAKKGKLPFKPVPVERPSWLQPWKGHGSAIVIKRINWELVPTLGDIRKEFPRYVRPSLAKCITVNGKGLVPLQVVGDTIQDTRVVSYLPGEQEIELYVPERKRAKQTVMLGGYGPICSLQAFVSNLTSEEQDMLPSELTNRDLCGIILIPALNAFRVHTSDRVDSSFYTKAHQALRANVIRFLIEVGEQVRAVFGKKGGKSQREQHNRIFANLTDEFGSAWGFDPAVIQGTSSVNGGAPSSSKNGKSGGRSRTANRLEVNTRRVTLTRGENHIFEVMSSGRFKWNAEEAGGTIRPLGNSKKAAYCAGEELGQFTLVVSDSNAPDLSARIAISIVEAHTFHIFPEEAVIVQGGSKIFRLANLRSSQGSLIWSLDEASSGVELSELSNGGARVSVGKNARPGNYTLVLQDGGGNTSSAILTIAQAPTDSDHHVKIEGQYYRLAASPFSRTVATVKRGSDRGRNKPRIDTMEIFFDHPLLKLHRSRRGKAHVEAHDQVIMEQVMLAHADSVIREEGGGDFREVIIRFTQLKEALLQTS